MAFLGIGFAILTVSLLILSELNRDIDDAEGLCEINERGEIGTSDEGDIVGGI